VSAGVLLLRWWMIAERLPKSVGVRQKGA
jgi:hypothetical protein